MMNTFCKTAIRSALIIAGLTAGFGMTAAYAADDAMPQAHSDGVGAAIADTAITAKVKAKSRFIKRPENIHGLDQVRQIAKLTSHFSQTVKTQFLAGLQIGIALKIDGGQQIICV